MIEKIISGGQTGTDRAALDFALKFFKPRGGWIPKGGKFVPSKIPLLNKTFKLNLILIIILWSFPAISYAGQFKVTRLTDGDTIKLAGNDGKMTIRLVGIDAPGTSKKKNQPGQPFSRKSTKYLANLVLNKSVELKSYGTDRYGRILGVVFVGDKNVNLEMVRAGLAEVYRGKPAGGLNLEPYWEAEAEAKKTGIGMWSLEDKYISPKEWRRVHGK